MINIIGSICKVWLVAFVAAYGCNVWSAEVPQDTGEDIVSAQKVTIEQLLSQGQRLLSAGQLNEAMAVFKQVLVRQPEHAGAIYQQGVILVRSNDYENGISRIERAVSLEPGNLVYKEALASMYEFVGRMDAALSLNEEIVLLADAGSDAFTMAQRNVGFITATKLARQGKILQAEQSFSRLSDIYPEDFMIRYSLGVALMLQGKLVGAEESLLKASEINPVYANTYLSLASLYEQQDRLSLAYEMLAKVLSLVEGGSLAERAQLRMFIIEGRLLSAEGNAAEALDVFNQALGLASDNLEVLFNLGLLYDRLLDWSGVINVSEQFLRQAPDQVDVRLGLAKAYINTHQYNLAATELQRIIDLAPNAPQGSEANFQLQRLMASSVGQSILDRQRDDEIESLQKHLSDVPEDVEALRSLATLLLQRERWQDARIPLEQLLSIDPSESLTYASLALVYDKLSLYEDAIKPYAYAVSLELNSDSAARIAASLLMVVAKALYTRGDLNGAEQYFSEIISRQGDNSEARFYAGLIYFVQDRIVEAIDSFQRVLQYVPGHIGARLNLANSYHRLKREEDAIEEFRNALHFDPDGPLADNIKEQMQAVEKSIRGFSGGISYVLAYDNNSNLNSSSPLSEYRTDLSPQLLYRYKGENGLRWLLSTVPSYSSYHNGQFDFLNTRSSITASVSKGRVTLSSGLSYQVSSGLINAERSSNNTALNGVWSGRFKLPVIFHPLSPARVLTNMSMQVSYAEFDSLGSPFYSAYNYSASASVNQPVAERTVLGLSYRSNLSENMYAEGSDNAFRGHGIDVRLERGVAAGVSVNGSYSLTLMDYLYPDSTTNFTRYRHNQAQSLVAGVNYQFHQSLRLFANISWSNNRSNLPVGFILNAQDVVEGQQSPSLGAYSRVTLTTGIALSL